MKKYLVIAAIVLAAAVGIWLQRGQQQVETTAASNAPAAQPVTTPEPAATATQAPVEGSAASAVQDAAQTVTDAVQTAGETAAHRAVRAPGPLPLLQRHP